MSPTLAVSTWSVHRALGLTYQQSPENSSGIAEASFVPGTCRLIDLPRELQRHGYARVEICHFHLASREPAYLADIRNAFAAGGVTIQTLLIDDGDLTHPEQRARDLDWIASWVEAAAVLGAANARVIAGKSKPTEDNLAMSVEGLRRLGRLGKARGIRVVTENWFDLTATPRAVGFILDALDGEVGFLADMGNWQGPTKYQDLRAIYARAEFSHTKAHFHGEMMDQVDFEASLQAAIAASYAGPHTLVFEGEGDEWAGLATERAVVEAVYANA